jgi:hypothetical protein
VYCPPYEFLCEAPPPLQAPAHMHILLSLDVFNTSSCQSKTLIDFDSEMNAANVKHIELANLSSKPLIYSVRIDGGT